MTTSVDIKDILIAQGSKLGLVFADNLYIGKEPELPDDCVTIFDTPGTLDWTLNQVVLEMAGIQIRVRNNRYEEGYDLAKAILDTLIAVKNQEINGTYYASIRATSLPFLLHWDIDNRAVFVVNFEILRRK